jgi:hypothetical protein
MDSAIAKLHEKGLALKDEAKALTGLDFLYQGI